MKKGVSILLAVCMFSFTILDSVSYAAESIQQESFTSDNISQITEYEGKIEIKDENNTVVQEAYVGQQYKIQIDENFQQDNLNVLYTYYIDMWSDNQTEPSDQAEVIQADSAQNEITYAFDKAGEYAVFVKVEDSDSNVITVTGAKETLTRALHPDMKVVIEGDQLTVVRPSDVKMHRSLHGLTRTLINNMVIGVTEGYQKVLEVNGVGYRAAKSGNKLTLNLGYSHPVEMIDPEGVETVVEGQNKITVKGIDKEKVGQYAAEIRDKRRPEPYKGKGIKYADEVIRRKVGKTGKK